MSDAVIGFHEDEAQAEHPPPAAPPRGFRRLLAPGWLRTLWTIPLFFGIGAGIDGARPLRSRAGIRSGTARSSRPSS